MFNFQPFSSNHPGASRAHLLDEDGQLAGVVSFTLNEDFVRVSAEVFDGDNFRSVRHSAVMDWGNGRPLIQDEVPSYQESRHLVPAWAFWRAA